MIVDVNCQHDSRCVHEKTIIPIISKKWLILSEGSFFENKQDNNMFRCSHAHYVDDYNEELVLKVI